MDSPWGTFSATRTCAFCGYIPDPFDTQARKVHAISASSDSEEDADDHRLVCERCLYEDLLRCKGCHRLTPAPNDRCNDCVAPTDDEMREVYRSIGINPPEEGA